MQKNKMILDSNAILLLYERISIEHGNLSLKKCKNSAIFSHDCDYEFSYDSSANTFILTEQFSGCAVK